MSHDSDDQHSAGEPERPAAESGARPRPPSPSKPRAPEIRYLGFRISDDGREYALRAWSEAFGSRLFLFLIPHQVFSARLASYQDGPDLCFQRLRGDLAADHGLQPSGRLVLSERELSDYRQAHLPPSARRKKRSRTVAAGPELQRADEEGNPLRVDDDGIGQSRC